MKPPDAGRLVRYSSAGSRFERERFHVRKEFGVSWLTLFIESIEQRFYLLRGKPILFGTIGAAFLEQRVLLLDFVAQRVAILGKGEELPAVIAGRTGFTPIEYRNSKMFVALALNGVEQAL